MKGTVKQSKARKEKSENEDSGREGEGVKQYLVWIQSIQLAWG